MADSVEQGSAHPVGFFERPGGLRDRSQTLLLDSGDGLCSESTENTKVGRRKRTTTYRQRETLANWDLSVSLGGCRARLPSDRLDDCPGTLGSVARGIPLEQ